MYIQSNYRTVRTLRVVTGTKLYSVMRLKGGYNMNLTVIGVQEKQGTYQGVDYDNYIIHCTREDENAFGVVSEQIKIKSKSVSDLFGFSMGNSDWCDLIGKNIRVFYNKYGNVDEVRITD